MSIGFSLLSFPVRSRQASRRRRPTTALRFEACEPRRVLSATLPAVADFAAADVWTAYAEGDDDHDHGEGHEGDVQGSVVDGRIVTNHRGYGYDFEPGETVFDVGFDITGLAVGTELQLEVMQGVTFWNGSGSTPRFSPVRGGVEMNFNNEAEDVRIGATRNVGSLLDIGEAVATEGGTEVHDHFNVTVGIGGSGGTFGPRRVPTGIYVVMGRLVGDGVNPSAPIAFVLNVGASEEAHGAAVEFFDDSPPVSVFGVTMPSQLNYGLGQPFQVTYRFSDAVTATGSPRLPLTIGGKPRFATLDRTASSGENLVFSYTMRAGDNGAVRPRGGSLAIQLPSGSRIRGAAGGTVFPAFAVTFPNVQALTTRPLVTRVQSQAGEGTFNVGDALDFRLTWNQLVGVGGTVAPTITVRAIGGPVLGAAEFVNPQSGPNAEYVFRYTVKAGDAARRGLQIEGPITLNGSTISDIVGNNSVLTFKPLRVPLVLIDTTVTV